MTATFKGNHWLNYVAKAFDDGKDLDAVLECLPKKQYAEATELIEFCGQDLALELGRTGKQAPHIVRGLEVVRGIFREYGLTATPERITRWMVEYTAQRKVQDLNKAMNRAVATRLHRHVMSGTGWGSRAKAPAAKLRAVK